MNIKDFITAFPDISLQEVMNNSDSIKTTLVDMYNKIEMISLNYKLDEMPQDQVQ
jgi:hypothetical protein